MDCIFCQIANRKIPKEFILETKNVMVFPDIYPAAPVHLLIVPKKHIVEFYKLGKFDKLVWDEMIDTVRKLINKYGLENKGYRILTNGGGAQAINHFHMHLLGKIEKQREL